MSLSFLSRAGKAIPSRVRSLATAAQVQPEQVLKSMSFLALSFSMIQKIGGVKIDIS